MLSVPLPAEARATDLRGSAWTGLRWLATAGGVPLGGSGPRTLGRLRSAARSATSWAAVALPRRPPAMTSWTASSRIAAAPDASVTGSPRSMIGAGDSGPDYNRGLGCSSGSHRSSGRPRGPARAGCSIRAAVPRASATRRHRRWRHFGDAVSATPGPEGARRGVRTAPHRHYRRFCRAELAKTRRASGVDRERRGRCESSSSRSWARSLRRRRGDWAGGRLLQAPTQTGDEPAFRFYEALGLEHGGRVYKRYWQS